MDSYVINLKRRADKWEQFQELNNAKGLAGYKRFNAISPGEVGFGFNMTPGEWGCYLSHRMIWSRVRENTLIMEDDATLTREFHIPELPEGFDLYYLGGNDTMFTAKPGEKCGHFHQAEQKITMHRCNRLLTTHAYIISPQGAKKALALEAGRQVDVMLIDIQSQGHSYYIKPSLFIQRAGVSDIHNKHVNFEHIT